MKLATAHPFPARMAPEVVAQTIDSLPSGSIVLDPMCGSGTTIRYSAQRGFVSHGLDLDPLAVTISQCWTAPPPTHDLVHDSSLIIERAHAIRKSGVEHPSWHNDKTKQFASFWFGEQQRLDLTAFAMAISKAPSTTRPALQTALSRLIVTKDRGASLARDVSHSRPHRVKLESDFSVFDAFIRSVELLGRRLDPSSVRAPGQVRLDDARALESVPSNSVDCVVTSPPYLNAIDYMRGHRLSLIWFGWNLEDLSAIRSTSVGAERGGSSQTKIEAYVENTGDQAFPNRAVGWVRKYIEDASQVAASLSRVCKERARIVMVIGNSNIRGARVDNAKIYEDQLASSGFAVSTKTRLIPAGNRYLPMGVDGSSLSRRMREEVVLTASR